MATGKTTHWQSEREDVMPHITNNSAARLHGTSAVPRAVAAYRLHNRRIADSAGLCRQRSMETCFCTLTMRTLKGILVHCHDCG